MKATDIHLMPWKWDGIVCTGGTPQDCARFAKTTLNADLEVGSNSAGHAHLEYGKPWLLWVETLANVPALAHEALHITGGLLEARGLQYTKASEEAYTYTMEDILRQTLAPRAKWRRV